MYVCLYLWLVWACNVVTYLSVFSIMYMSVYRFICMSIGLSIYLFVYKSFRQFDHLIFFIIYISVYFFIQFICLSVYSSQSTKSVCTLVRNHLSILFLKIILQVIECVSALVSKCSDAPMHQCPSSNSNFYSFEKY